MSFVFRRSFVPFDNAKLSSVFPTRKSFPIFCLTSFCQKMVFMTKRKKGLENCQNALCATAPCQKGRSLSIGMETGVSVVGMRLSSKKWVVGAS